MGWPQTLWEKDKKKFSFCPTLTAISSVGAIMVWLEGQWLSIRPESSGQIHVLRHGPRSLSLCSCLHCLLTSYTRLVGNPSLTFHIAKLPVSLVSRKKESRLTWRKCSWSKSGKGGAPPLAGLLGSRMWLSRQQAAGKTEILVCPKRPPGLSGTSPGWLPGYPHPFQSWFVSGERVPACTGSWLCSLH